MCGAFALQLRTKDPREVKESLSQMKLVKGGRFIMGRDDKDLTIPTTDTILQKGNTTRFVNVSDF